MGLNMHVTGTKAADQVASGYEVIVAQKRVLICSLLMRKTRRLHTTPANKTSKSAACWKSEALH